MALEGAQNLTMTDAEFRKLSDQVRSRCGLHFDEESRYLLEKRVLHRVRQSDAGSIAAYQYLLRSGRQGEDEFASLIDSLTTNETYFFREYSQLRALVDEVVPELLTRRRASGATSPITIWSAGCSSGEEPYSIAALLLEAGFEPGRDVHIYASDISRQMLTKSRRGLYRESSFRETSDTLRDKYFSEKDGQYRICDALRKHTDFIHLNLLDRGKIALLGAMDVVFCRNVIIYFNLETKKQLIQTFYDKLSPGGYLLLGHSESLINLSSAFELKHLTNDLVYRRPMPGEEVEDRWHEIARATVTDVGDSGANR